MILEAAKTKKTNPHKAEIKAAQRKAAKPLLYIGIVSIVMLFAGLTSAYVVRAVGSTVTAEEIINHCATRLPFAKRPKVVVFGDEIPLTVTGKYQRLKLKPLFIQFQSMQFRPD